MSQESGQDKTMDNKEVGVKRRLRILQDVNRFSQVVDALKRPANAHVAQPLKKHRTSITQDATFSSDSSSLKTSCTVDHNCNSSLAVAEERRGKTLPVSVEEEDTECLVIDVSTRQISEITDKNRHIKEQGSQIDLTEDKRITSEISYVLKRVFEKIPTPTDEQIQRLSGKYGVSPTKIKGWFARQRRKAEQNNVFICDTQPCCQQNNSSLTSCQVSSPSHKDNPGFTSNVNKDDAICRPLTIQGGSTSHHKMPVVTDGLHVAPVVDLQPSLQDFLPAREESIVGSPYPFWEAPSVQPISSCVLETPGKMDTSATSPKASQPFVRKVNDPSSPSACYSPVKEEYSSCASAELPKRLQEFLNSIKDTELENMLDTVDNVEFSGSLKVNEDYCWLNQYPAQVKLAGFHPHPRSHSEGHIHLPSTVPVNRTESTSVNRVQNGKTIAGPKMNGNSSSQFDFAQKMNGNSSSQFDFAQKMNGNSSSQFDFSQFYLPSHTNLQYDQYQGWTHQTRSVPISTAQFDLYNAYTQSNTFCPNQNSSAYICQGMPQSYTGVRRSVNTFNAVEHQMCHTRSNNVMSYPGSSNVMSHARSNNVMSHPRSNNITSHPISNNVMSHPRSNNVMSHPRSNNVMSHLRSNRGTYHLPIPKVPLTGQGNNDFTQGFTYGRQLNTTFNQMV